MYTYLKNSVEKVFISVEKGTYRTRCCFGYFIDITYLSNTLLLWVWYTWLYTYNVILFNHADRYNRIAYYMCRVEYSFQSSFQLIDYGWLDSLVCSTLACTRVQACWCYLLYLLDRIMRTDGIHSVRHVPPRRQWRWWRPY